MNAIKRNALLALVGLALASGAVADASAAPARLHREAKPAAVRVVKANYERHVVARHKTHRLTRAERARLAHKAEMARRAELAGKRS